MNILLVLAIIVLLIVLACKLSGKLLKTIIIFVFVGFVIYVLTGTDVISDFLTYLGIEQEVSNVIRILQGLF